MHYPPLMVVADCGHAKAYRFEKAVNRAPSPVLLDRLDLEEAFQKYDQRFTDQAGAFPSGAAAGTANGAADRLSLEAETKTRLRRQIADRIAGWLAHQQPETWWFAAPVEINGAILRDLPKKHRDLVTCNLKQDLVHLPASKLLEHFQPHLPRPVQPTLHET